MQWTQPTEKKLTGGTNWQAKTNTLTTWSPTPLPSIPHMVTSLLLKSHLLLAKATSLASINFKSIAKAVWDKSGGSGECL